MVAERLDPALVRSKPVVPLHPGTVVAGHKPDLHVTEVIHPVAARPVAHEPVLRPGKPVLHPVNPVVHPAKPVLRHGGRYHTNRRRVSLWRRLYFLEYLRMLYQK